LEEEFTNAVNQLKSEIAARQQLEQELISVQKQNHSAEK
jgi:hypothetical protein